LIRGRSDEQQCNLHIGFVYEPDWTFTKPNVFEPAYRRGARLSHAWVQGFDDRWVGLAKPVDFEYIKHELPQDKRERWRYSILDLVPANAYLLVLSGSALGDDEKRWAALEKGLSSVGVQVNVLAIGKDFHWAEPDAGKAWEAAYGVPEGGAVLVRPDQHVEAVIQGSEGVEAVVRGIGRSLVDGTIS
jgi:hypothetical protein